MKWERKIHINIAYIEQLLGLISNIQMHPIDYIKLTRASNQQHRHK